MLARLLLLASPLVVLGLASEQATEPPDLVVFLLDDVGTRDVFPHVETPTLEALARTGTSFRRFYTQPSCSPTRAALLTGLHPHRAGNRVGVNVLGLAPESESNRGLPRGTSTVAHRLRDAGYATALFGKWHLDTKRDDSPFAPLEYGFDHYDGHPGNFVEPDRYASWRRTKGRDVELETTYATTAEVDAFLAWWHATPKPRFAVVSFHAPHATHQGTGVIFEAPPAELLPAGYRIGKTDRARYEASIVALDRELGRAVDALDWERTLGFFLGDNGTPRPVRPPAVRRKVGFKGHLLPGGLHVPCFARGLGVSAGGVTDALAHVTDLYPTLLDVAGVPAPKGLDGHSLVRVLADPRAALRETALVSRIRPNGPPPWSEITVSAFNATHWLLRKADGEESLFDLRTDPWCIDPLSFTRDPNRRIAAVLRETMKTNGPRFPE